MTHATNFAWDGEGEKDKELLLYLGMEYLDTIILAIGILVSFFFHWKQYQREKRRENLELDEKKEAKKKQMRFSLGDFSCWTLNSYGNISQICDSQLTITNIGNSSIYIQSVDIDFKNQPEEIDSKSYSTIGNYGRKSPICIQKGETAKYKIKLKSNSSASLIKEKLNLSECRVKVTELQGMIYYSDFQPIICIDGTGLPFSV